ncbi:MAG: hypothetical protein AAGB13_07390 [Cyanobacteria bacterium P01_F01_bin.33]
MATEEELRDAQIDLVGAQKLKTANEAELAKEQLRELQRSSHIVRRVSQGIGVGLVLALAGMALFGPIKDVIEADSQAAKAKSDLAAINARIAETKNTELRDQLDQRQNQLEDQQARYTDDIRRLAEDLRKANLARDEAINRYGDLKAREKELAAKYDQLASRQQDNTELVAQAAAAQSRAEQLESEIEALRLEAKAAEESAAEVQNQVYVAVLRDYRVAVGSRENVATESGALLNAKLAIDVEMTLADYDLEYDNLYGDECKHNIVRPTIYFHGQENKHGAEALALLLENSMPKLKFETISSSDGPSRKTLAVCMSVIPEN